jgi:sulfite reductase alpha subunit-like flavoprotein
LGAKLFHKVGLGDYQHDFGYEGEFDPWQAMMWETLKPLLPEKQMTLSSDGELLPPIYKVEVLSSEETKSREETLHLLPPPHGAINPSVFLSKIVKNERLTSLTHFQDTRHLTLTMPAEGFDYEPGDVLML